VSKQKKKNAETQEIMTRVILTLSRAKITFCGASRIRTRTSNESTRTSELPGTSIWIEYVRMSLRQELTTKKGKAGQKKIKK
jgi:hypothetical protein